MYRYVFKRLVLMIPILLGVSFVVFSILALTPGDPGTIMLGGGALQEDIDKLNHELGYDRPFLERYVNYIYRAVFHFDFGISYTNKLPVFKEVLAKTPISMTIAFNAILCAACIGIPIGVLSAVKQYSLFDTLPTFMAMFLASVPAFWLGMMMMLFFSLRLKWLPTSGIASWKGYVMPMLALGLPYAAQQLRFTRSSMLETIRQDYIRTARAKGAPERVVIWTHAMKNALLPVITIMGVNFGALLGGAIVTETLFGIPGLGTYIVNGIKMKDVPAVMAGTMALALVSSTIMLIVDLLYAVVDPRIKAQYSGRRG